MYPVTEEFKEKIMTPFNRQVFGKIEVDYTSPFLDESIEVEVNEEANISYPNQTADSVQSPIGKILSLDGSCEFDGEYILAPIEQVEVNQMGWWGSQLSNGSAEFVVPYPTLEVVFIARPITKLNVRGDSQRGEYPVDFNIYIYDDLMNLLHTENVVGNSSVSYTHTLVTPITDVVMMVLEITKWSHAGRQVKIMEFYTSIKETYTDSDIVNITLIEQMEEGSGSLPFGKVTSSQITISLNNVDKRFDAGNTQSPLYNVLKPNRRIKAYLGIEKDDLSMEYVPLGIFWSDDWSVSSNTLYAKTSGRDRLSFLDSGSYSTVTVLADVSAYDLVYDVLDDFGLTADEYIIDTQLEDVIFPYAYYEEISHLDILREIVEACLGRVYCDRDGRIVVESLQEIGSLYTVVANEEANISYPEQVTDGILDPDGLYLSLDGYSEFDGTYDLAPETAEDGQMGWWGEQLSDVNGDFTTPYPTIEIQFSQRSISVVNVVGDSLKGEYPVDFTINVYDVGDNLLATNSITGNTDVSVDVEIAENPTTATSVELIITKWSLANAQVKILELMGSEFKPPITDAMYFVKNNPLNYREMANRIVVSYTPMNSLGEQSDAVLVVVENANSITENGVVKFELLDNPLIQTSDFATWVANALIGWFSDPRRKLELQWRGDPSILLGDIVKIIDTEETNYYKVSKQELTYTGFLRAKLSGRKVVE